MPLYCAGEQLVAHHPVAVIMDGVGLNITVLSYQGRLDFGLVVDRDQVDDAWPMLDRLREGLDELDHVICGARRSRPSRAAPGDRSAPVGAR